MKKVFVLYSLRQKLTPLIYKTKSIVTKHINTNKSLLYQQFDNEQQAKTFIQKFSIQCITNSLNNKNIISKQLISQAQVKNLVQSIVGRERLQEKGKVKSIKKPSVGGGKDRVSQQQQQHQQNKSSSRQAQWTILPNGHAFRKSSNNTIDSIRSTNITTTSHIQTTPTQQMIDSSYSTLTNNNRKPQLHSSHETNNQSYNNDSSHQQMISLLTTEQHTTEGLTEEGSFNNNYMKDKSGKLSYWMVWNASSCEMIKVGKRRAELGLLMYELEVKHSKDWVKKNIQIRRFRNKMQAFLHLEQLNKQKDTKLNKMKADRIRENITMNINVTNNNDNSKLSLVVEKQQQAFEVGKLQTSQQMKVQQQYIMLNYDDIEDLTYQQVIQSNDKKEKVDGKGKQRRKIKLESEKILWADDLIKQAIEVEQQGESMVVDNNNVNNIGVVMGSIGMGAMAPFVEQEYQVSVNNTSQPILTAATITANHAQTIISQQQTSATSYQQQKQQQVEKQLLVKQQMIQQLNQSKEQLQTIVNFYQQIQQMQQINTTNKQQPVVESQQLPTTQQFNQQQPQQKPHPYNKRYIKQLILNKLHTQHHEEEQQRKQLSSHQDSNEQYIIYPSFAIKQSPGFAIGSYEIKSSTTSRLIKKQSIPLGQCRYQQATLLSLAFTLSSTCNLHNSNKRIKLRLNKQMRESLKYEYRVDKEMREVREFIREVENRCGNRVQYIL